MVPKGAILTDVSISTDRRYSVVKLFANGVIVGSFQPADPTTDWHIAIHRSIRVSTQTIRPVVGEYRIGQGWIFPNGTFQAVQFKQWLRDLRCTPRLEWDRRLDRYVVQVPVVKVAIEDWSLDDTRKLIERGWFVGHSAHAPLWRIYAKIPVEAWDGGLMTFLAFDGQVRRINRFGAIYDPRQHKLVWKLQQ